MLLLLLPTTLSLLLLRSTLGHLGHERNTHSTTKKASVPTDQSPTPSNAQENRSVYISDSDVSTGPSANASDLLKERTSNDQLVYSLLSNQSQVSPRPNGRKRSTTTSLTTQNTRLSRFGTEFSSGGLPPEIHQEVHLNERRLYHALQTKHFADGTEERLYRTLLSEERYEKDVRPTGHHSQPTNVTFGFLLNQIVEMDERNQVLTTRSWLNINWMDKRLTWNYTEWGGIKTIYIPYRRLWKPDIILVNNAIREYHASLVSTDIMVTSNGNVTWLFSALFRSSCPIRVRYYPFDDQECDLKFASWSHDASEIDLGLNTDKGDLSSYMNNSEFDLLDMIAIKEVVSFPSNPLSKWPTIVVRIKMHRRPLFYIFNHIIPCVLISSMAVLGFLMPPETGEKINMIITTLLSMGVYLQSITESIPPTSEAVPLIGMYYVSSLFMVCLATCVNVITLNMHRNGAANQGRHVPCWMEKWVLGYLASLMRMSIREPDSISLLKIAQSKKSTIRRSSIMRDLKRIKNHDHKRGGLQQSTECDCITQDNHLSYVEAIPQLSSNGTNGGSHSYKQFQSESAFLGRIVGEQILPRISVTRSVMLSEFDHRFRRILKRIYRSLQQHEIREEIIDERQRIQWQWQQLASVVDRLLLVLFSLATLFTIFFFLLLPVGLRDEDEHLRTYN
uniref:Ligand-gated ion channel 4 n=3 Tax=Trichostrongylidae TaxID=6315 RepID=A0A7I4Y174_HAECO